METVPEAVPTEPPSCVHHWMLEAPGAGVTNGVCRTCGAVRSFSDARKPYSRMGGVRK